MTAEYYIAQTSFKDWGGPVANQDLDDVVVEAGDCFSSVEFTAAELNGQAFNLSGTDTLIWAANGEDRFMGYHGRSNRGIFEVNWQEGASDFTAYPPPPAPRPPPPACPDMAEEDEPAGGHDHGGHDHGGHEGHDHGDDEHVPEGWPADADDTDGPFCVADEYPVYKTKMAAKAASPTCQTSQRTYRLTKAIGYVPVLAEDADHACPAEALDLTEQLGTPQASAGLSSGALVGIIVGCVVGGLALLGGVVALVMMKRNKDVSRDVKAAKTSVSSASATSSVATTESKV